MSYAFSNSRNSLSQSDYIKQKQQCKISKKNNQRLKTDLATVCTVSNIFPYNPPEIPFPCEKCPNNDEPVIINSTTVFYKQYAIDPLGQLFGNTPCGILNYTKYMI
jgi:hypothetical protein